PPTSLYPLSLHDALPIFVDAISGAGALRLETAAWGVDVVVVGSQKALALPPGLAFVSMSAKAWAAAASAKAPRFYFDLVRERKADRKSTRLNSSHVSISY